MADLNKTFLMGRLTADPELRRTGGGMAVADLRLATSNSWIGKDGEKREEKLFIDVVVWDRAAESACKYLRRGSQIHVEGRLKTDSWEKDGEKKYKTSVVADRVQFLDSKPQGDRDDDAPPAPTPEREKPKWGGPAERKPEPAKPATTSAVDYVVDEDDSDIPF